jgi:hypothetical protein
MVVLLFTLTGCAANNVAELSPGIEPVVAAAVSRDVVSVYNHDDAVSGFPRWHGYLHPIPGRLDFASLEQFLFYYDAARAGTVVWPERRFAGFAAMVNFTALERLYLPIGIPETYQIAVITITHNMVTIEYRPVGLTSGHPMNEATLHLSMRFSFTRWGASYTERQQRRHSSAGVFEGEYFFDRGRGTLSWSTDSADLWLSLPRDAWPGNDGLLPFINRIDGTDQRIVYKAAAELAPLIETGFICLTYNNPLVQPVQPYVCNVDITGRVAQ